MITIQYDTAIEVTKEQYTALMNVFSQQIAGRDSGGKFFIKVWDMNTKDLIEGYLNDESDIFF